MNRQSLFSFRTAVVLIILSVCSIPLFSELKKESSYSPDIKEPFGMVMAVNVPNKPSVMNRQMEPFNERYDLNEQSSLDAFKSNGKMLPFGSTGLLLSELTSEKLPRLSPDEIKEGELFPNLPRPHPKHPARRMRFTPIQIDQFPQLKRFNMDFDLPDHVLPDFPPAPKLDISGRLLTLEDVVEFFDLVQQLKLSDAEKNDLVVFLRIL